jgi:citrate synthase
VEFNASVKSRGDAFVERAATAIWEETAAEENPFVAESCRCHGYELLDLIKKRSFVDVLYLLLKGELPTQFQRELLESLMIGLCNPGPRHPATRAAMNAAVSKTYVGELLPIGLLTLSGSHLGAAEVEGAMRFIRKSRCSDPGEAARALRDGARVAVEGDRHIAPGFGSCYGEVDLITARVATLLVELPGAGAALRWASGFAHGLRDDGMGWLPTGLAAAVFLDLGLHPRVGPGLFQLVSAPGLLAHATEMAPRPMTAMPFLPSDRYIDESGPS